MALLQIAEPGQSTDPHQHRLAVGIDLGTTHSLVATVRNGASEVLLDAEQRALLPSVVRYHHDGGCDVGWEAKAAAARDPQNTIVSVKRFMGRALGELPEGAHRTYEFVDAPGMVQLRTCAGIKSPIEVSADILSSLRERAEQALGGELLGAVITVPAYFDDAQRQATKDAARLAGLNVLRLLNEPTAAAVAYGLDNASEGVFAVYDLGGGTFDFSILKLSRGVFEVLATSGDSALGGDDFDQRISDWLQAELADRVLCPGDYRSISAAARIAKELLSSTLETNIRLQLANGLHCTRRLTREHFEALTQDLLQKSLRPVQRALRDAGLTVDAISGVVLVGGATRMPCVGTLVEEFFRQTPLSNLDPDQVVALGAAMQANALVGNRGQDDWLLLDVTPLSLGLEVMGGLVEKIVPRNATLPVARAQDFTTFRDGQTALSVHVLQGERELVTDCRSLAHFELRGIPPMAAGAARIRVTFQIDADGLLSVSAREQSLGVEAAVTVKPSCGLSDDSIARMLAESYAHAREDAELRQLREHQVEATRTIEATVAALAKDGDTLLSSSEKAALEAAVKALQASIEGASGEAIHRATEALNELSLVYAGRRMDAAIQTALAGRKLEEI